MAGEDSWLLELVGVVDRTAVTGGSLPAGGGQWWAPAAHHSYMICPPLLDVSGPMSGGSVGPAASSAGAIIDRAGHIRTAQDSTAQRSVRQNY